MHFEPFLSALKSTPCHLLFIHNRFLGMTTLTVFAFTPRCFFRFLSATSWSIGLTFFTIFLTTLAPFFTIFLTTLAPFFTIFVTTLAPLTTFTGSLITLLYLTWYDLTAFSWSIGARL